MTRFVRSICAAVALLASAASALGQSSILQGGAWTPGHSPMYVGQGQSQPIVQDSGPAGGGGIGLGLSEQLLSVRSPTGTYPAVNAGSGPLFTNWCDYDGPITGPYHYLCIGPNASGGGLIAYGFGGGATALPFSFNINGTATQLPAAGSGGTFVTVVIPTTSGAPVCFSGTVGLITACPGITNAQLATVPAATFKGNPTATANVAPVDFTIAGLTARGAPDANNDKLVLLNNATGAFNYVTPGQIATAATAGVSSLCSLTGALTATQVTACLNLFSSSLQGLVPASGGGTTNFLRADATFAPVAASVCGQTGAITAAQIITNCGIAWSNTRLAKTSAYTAASGDTGDTIALSGNASYGVTFNAPSGYTVAAAFLVRNEDTSHGKFIYPQFAASVTNNTIAVGSKAFTTASGLTISVSNRYRVYSLANTANFMAGTATYSGTTFTLTVDTTGGSGTFTDWQIAPEVRMAPGTERWVYNQNNVWLLDPRTRWLTPGRGNVYELCVRQDGSDSNDGFGSAATDCLANAQTAINIIGTEWDGGGYNGCAVGFYAGGTSIFDFGSGLSQTGQSIGCQLTYNIRGVVTLTSTGSLMNAGDNSISIWNWNLGFAVNLKGNTSNTANAGQFKLHQIGVYDFNGGIANWFPGGVTGLGTGGTKGTNDTFLDVDLQGSATINTTINIGNGTDTFQPSAALFCEAHCSKITFSGSVGFSALVTMVQAFVLRAGSVITTTVTWPGASITQPSTPTGNSVLITNGTTIPGGTSTLTGGQVCTSVC